MIELYHGGGAGDFDIMQNGATPDRCRVIFENAAHLLSARSQMRAAEILRSTPFRILDATNNFNDNFSVLLAVLPLDEYERLRHGSEDPNEGGAYRQIAEVLSEIGAPVRFIAADLALDRPEHPDARGGLGLKQSEVNKLVNKYIGVSGGYLADFSYRSHHEFYVEMDLDIDPYKYGGTTRERFIKILSESTPCVQARILEGVLDRFPVGSTEIRTKERATEIRGWIARLRAGSHVEQPALRITSEVVERALLDAQELLRATGATSGVDRVHTALHGYMREVCQGTGLTVAEDATLPELFKRIREAHPAFSELGPRSDDILRVLRALATILDSFGPLRNKASVAHPNAELLPQPEAMLVINAARSLLRYIDEKVHLHVTANATGGRALS